MVIVAFAFDMPANALADAGCRLALVGLRLADLANVRGDLATICLSMPETVNAVGFSAEGDALGAFTTTGWLKPSSGARASCGS